MLASIASKCKEKLYSSTISYHYYFFSNFASPLFVKGIRGCTRNHHCISYVKYIPIRVSRCCQIGDLSNSDGNRHSYSTQISPKEIADQILTQILASIEEDPSISREELCIHYIQKLCASENLLAALSLVQTLRGRNIFLTSHAYDYILEAASEKNDIDLLSETYENLLLSCGFINPSSYLIIARAFSNHNDPAILLNFITKVLEMKLPRNDIFLNRVIFALDKCGQVDKALSLFYHMKSLKYKPDLVTYNTIIAILGRLGRVEEMLQEFDYLKTVDLVPDLITYNTILNCLRKMGRLDLCVVYFKEMSERGIQPDTYTFKALIESLGRTGNIEDALKFFNELKRKGIVPSVHIYRALIFSLKKMGKMELALKFSDEMNECLKNKNFVGPRDFQYENR
ncbi:hypothetical protein ACJIZ3_007435 [Penstemon smallii]|uniref:Pentatricopeptide repeat-containing protein n=1 Tax=Penstemon smallii TaxID=265156 RepID=A0ABD3SAW3_9LAMI